MSQITSLFDRTMTILEERRQRIISGKINCIPWGLPRFEQWLPGIEQKKYYLVTANSKVGKTQLADYLFLYNPLHQVLSGKLNVKLKIFYFTLEMDAETKMIQAMSNVLFMKEKIKFSPTDLSSTREAISQETLDLIKEHEDYFRKFEECVTFIDNVRNPTGIYKFMRDYAQSNGTQYKKTIDRINNKTGEVDGTLEVDDYYEPHDPDEYVMVIVDHISLIDREKDGGQMLSKRDSISKLSANYMVKLRNKYKYIPVVVQQQSASQESIENAKANRLKPSVDGLGENKITQQDANVVLGLFSPYRHEIPQYFGYDVTFFKDNIRFLEILVSREGGGNTICPLYFDGAVNYFRELPKPDDPAIESVKDFVKKYRK